MSEVLRDWRLVSKVAREISDSFEEQCQETGSFAADVMAKRILAIPEIAEALEQKRRHDDYLQSGTRLVREMQERDIRCPHCGEHPLRERTATP